MTEIFDQDQTVAVDILWAIDASCSMGEEQEELIANLSQFVAYADANGVHYQMAVTEAFYAASDDGRVSSAREALELIEGDDDAGSRAMGLRPGQ